MRSQAAQLSKSILPFLICLAFLCLAMFLSWPWTLPGERDASRWRFLLGSYLLKGKNLGNHGAYAEVYVAKQSLHTSGWQSLLENALSFSYSPLHPCFLTVWCMHHSPVMPSLPTTCPSVPLASLLTLLSIMNEYLTTQLGLGLAPSVSVPGTVDSWLSSGLLVGRTEKENKICWGVGLQSKQRKMCLPTVPCG